MELEFSKLIKTLEDNGCTGVKYYYEINRWYKLEMIYNNRYKRFFALSFEELEDYINDLDWR